jgi:hypothetical protein
VRRNGFLRDRAVFGSRVKLYAATCGAIGAEDSVSRQTDETLCIDALYQL